MSGILRKGAAEVMVNKMKILVPFGVSNFEEIRRDGLYYVDKTLLIEKLIESTTKVTLFTRPRRFGKTLTM